MSKVLYNIPNINIYMADELELDKKDTAILRILKRDSRSSIRSKAKETGIRPSTVHQRIKRLRETGAIIQFTVKIDDELVGEKLTVFILIAGAPGMGKSTFAQALATFYANQNRTVKTIEAPRDLILKDNVTQYAVSHGDLAEIHDILLLSRPDNTVFDEMRNTPDFMLYADLRLSGIGLAGVVHATTPIDANRKIRAEVVFTKLFK